MKVLLIGGTGTISMAVTRLLLKEGHELTLVNRGQRKFVGLPEGGTLHTITADVHDEAALDRLLGTQEFDCVGDFIAFGPEDIERDFRLFRGRTRQYIFTSSASAYQKPPRNVYVDESTPLCNPYWEYSRKKIAAEEALMRHYREDGFPATIVRPSHTYDERRVPVAVHGKKGSYQVLARMLAGKSVLIPGDGTSLWTVTFNTDFAKGYVGLVGNVHAIGQAVQITSDESLTWNQIYGIIADSLHVELKAAHVASEVIARCDEEMGMDYGLRGNLLGDKACSVIFNNAKLKRLVPGFTATVRADQGIRRAVENIQATPSLQVADPDFDAFCDKVIGQYT